MRHEEIEEAFRALALQDQSGHLSCNIDSAGFFTYFYDSEEIGFEINEEHIQVTEDGVTVYRIPRNGDLLLSIDIEGAFENAELFQYDFTGSRKVIYATLDAPGTMAPFPYSGIPLLQVGKAVYLQVKTKQQMGELRIKAIYALLESTSRKKIVSYDAGVKIMHQDGQVYKVYGMLDYGYSPNFLGLELDSAGMHVSTICEQKEEQETSACCS
jgi:hypothetical protein